MRSMSLGEVCYAVGGRLSDESARDLLVEGVSNDTRTLTSRQLYVALRGENFDGHAFLPQAADAQAVGAIVESGHTSNLTLPCIVVENTRKAFGQLARYHRRSCSATTFIAVAGSNGKTTTREMISCVLKPQGALIRNAANHNNDIGVPQTLFTVDASIRNAVIEIGTNAPGEIEYLSKIVKPQIAVLTSISEEHLDGLGDIQGVIEEEAAALRELNEDGIAVINYDDQYCLKARRAAQCRVISYGFDERCEIRGSDLIFDNYGATFRVNERYAFRLPVLGEHNVSNALAAIAVGWAQGMPIEAMQEALSGFTPVDKRMQLQSIRGITLLNDCYNANPASMRAALKTLNDFKAKRHRIVALGDMLELGTTAKAQHEMLAWYVATRQVDHLVCVGPLMHSLGRRVQEYGVPVSYYDNAYDAGLELAPSLKTGDTVLVKGSRGLRMERLIQALSETLEAQVSDISVSKVSPLTIGE